MDRRTVKTVWEMLVYCGVFERRSGRSDALARGGSARAGRPIDRRSAEVAGFGFSDLGSGLAPTLDLLFRTE